jgi:hypothetical protein
MRDGHMVLSWPAGRTTIRYTAGYTLDGAQRNVPPDLERACIIIVKALFHARDRDPALRSETLEDVGSFAWSTGMSRAIPPDAAAILAGFRIPSI